MMKMYLLNKFPYLCSLHLCFILHASQSETHFLKLLPWFIDKCVVFQAERYVDRKIDQAESKLKKSQKKAKKWYAAFIGDDNGPKINNLHIFLVGFTGGVAVGLACAKF